MTPVGTSLGGACLQGFLGDEDALCFSLFRAGMAERFGINVYAVIGALPVGIKVKYATGLPLALYALQV